MGEVGRKKGEEKVRGGRRGGMRKRGGSWICMYILFFLLQSSANFLTHFIFELFESFDPVSKPPGIVSFPVKHIQHW